MCRQWRMCGTPGYESVNWIAVPAPAGLPAAIAEKVHACVSKAVAAPDLRERFTAAGMEPRSLPFAEVLPYVRSEIAKWGGVVMASGARPEG